MPDVFSDDERALVVKSKLELIGPLKDISRISIYYASRWWIDFLKDKTNRYSFSLLHILNIGRHDANSIAKSKPPLLRSSLGLQFVEFHEAVSQSLAKLDEAAELIKTAMITASWHRALRAAFLEAARRFAAGKALAAYLGEVFPLGEDLKELGLEIFSYDRREDAAADAAMMGVGQVELANSACETAKALYDSVLAFDSFYFSYDPLAELRCLADRLRRGGKLIVANADAASLPSVAAVYLWGGGRTALAGRDLDNIIRAAGLSKVAIYLRDPYYIAIFEKS